MGSLIENDIYMAHISISRIHSVILIEKNLGVCIIGLIKKFFYLVVIKIVFFFFPLDLGSKGGTFVDNKRI